MDMIQGIINNISYNNWLEEEESKTHHLLDVSLHMEAQF